MSYATLLPISIQTTTGPITAPPTGWDLVAALAPTQTLPMASLLGEYVIAANA